MSQPYGNSHYASAEVGSSSGTPRMISGSDLHGGMAHFEVSTPSTPQVKVAPTTPSAQETPTTTPARLSRADRAAAYAKRVEATASAAAATPVARKGPGTGKKRGSYKKRQKSNTGTKRKRNRRRDDYFSGSDSPDSSEERRKRAIMEDQAEAMKIIYPDTSHLAARTTITANAKLSKVGLYFQHSCTACTVVNMITQVEKPVSPLSMYRCSTCNCMQAVHLSKLKRYVHPKETQELKKQARTWTDQQVTVFIESLNLPSLKKLFDFHSIDGLRLLNLTNGDLRQTYGVWDMEKIESVVQSIGFLRSTPASLKGEEELYAAANVLEARKNMEIQATARKKIQEAQAQQARLRYKLLQQQMQMKAKVDADLQKANPFGLSKGTANMPMPNAMAQILLAQNSKLMASRNLLLTPDAMKAQQLAARSFADTQAAIAANNPYTHAQLLQTSMEAITTPGAVTGTAAAGATAAPSSTAAAANPQAWPSRAVDKPLSASLMSSLTDSSFSAPATATASGNLPTSTTTPLSAPSEAAPNPVPQQAAIANAHPTVDDVANSAASASSS